MRRTSKAPSAVSTHGSRRKARGLFGLACLCVLGLAVFLGSSAPSVGAAESFPGQGFLPDNRAWEMVSPPAKNGGQVVAFSQRTRAARDGSAVEFLSLQGFADAVGSGVGFEYIAQRSADAHPGDSGWSTHAITPPQASLSLIGNVAGNEPRYQGEFSNDLSKGVFFAYSPVETTLPSDQSNVAAAPNLYRRTDLRVPGAGAYQLLSDCPLCVSEGAPLTLTPGEITSKPTFAGASKDFSHIIFESPLRLTADATKKNANLYESHDGVTRLVGVLPSGKGAKRSIGGRGSASFNSATGTSHPISADGSRIFFTAAEGNGPAVPGGIYARIDGRSTVQLNVSERAVPDVAKNATYWDASSDGSRAFFTSVESLTDDAPINTSPKLYMWKQASHDEGQALTVDAQGGAFTLTLPTQPATATGTLKLNNNTVTAVKPTSGAFSVGQEISGPGIPAGTTITAMSDFLAANSSTLTLSAQATAAGSNKALSAIFKATTAPLPFDATAQQVQEALEALAPIGAGNVSVSGGPGAPGGPTLYAISFTGDLAGVNMPQLSAGAALLTGSAPSATVTTAQPVNNLTYLNVDGQPENSGNIMRGVIGASEDGHYVYFAAHGQLVDGAPEIGIQVGIYLWHEGALSYIGMSPQWLVFEEAETVDGTPVLLKAKESSVTPDGRHLLFPAHSGEGLLSAHPGGVDYDHGTCGGCRELYVYSADTDTLRCASCNPSGAAATTDAFATVPIGSGDSGAAVVVANSNPRSLSADGRYAFFSTAEKLVGEDANGVADAYVYDTTTGEPHLLSSGESPIPSYFLEASADGHDAFFATREQLSGWDVDTGVDLYDARVGGGFPEPSPPPPSCQGDACQPAPLVLDDPTPSSSSAHGPGNQVSSRKGSARCAKGQRKVQSRNGKARCVKPKQRKRHANSNRRAGR